MRRVAFPLLAFLLLALSVAPVSAGDRPNILWIISEDTGPEIGCYGDPYAVTPNIDRLASQGLRFDFCWSNCPVCAPARTTLISGLYPSSTGAEHMRSLVRLPEVRGVGVRDRALRAHPVQRGAGVEAARERDADLLAGGESLQDVGHVVSPKRRS